MALIIGLTGSIASGKSTVSSMFREFEIPVVDADQIAREVVCPGEKAYMEIIDAFGEEILLKDKTIDRKKLGSLIFNNKTKRSTLNSIVHPAVRNEMLTQRDTYVRNGAKCVVLDIPLLFESKLTHFVDKTVVVFVDQVTQLNRLMNRDKSTEEEAKSRINSQISMAEKANMADKVIDNNGTIEQTSFQLREILKEWQII